MSTTHFVVAVETTHDVDQAVADAWVDQLQAWHGVVSQGPGGHLVVTLTLPAESLASAAATGVIIAEWLAPALVVEVMPEKVRDARQGWAPLPELLSVSEAATRLGVSRQRVLHLINAGDLPAERVGTAWVLSAAAVDARAVARVQETGPAIL